MRKDKCRLIALVAVLLTAAAAGNAQQFAAVADGVEHAVTTRSAGGPVVINILRLDPKQVRLDVHHARDAAVGTETTSSIAGRHRAIAAINAGFFRLDQSQLAGEAAGVLMIDGRLLSESMNDRVAVFINNDNETADVRFGQLTVGESFEIGNRSFDIAGLNREIKANELIKYTHGFPGALVAANKDLQVMVIDSRIIEIAESGGLKLLPTNGFILAAKGEQARALRPLLKIGRKVNIFTNVNVRPEDDRVSKAFARAEDITNGVGLLIKDGKAVVTWTDEKAAASFAENKHPRTAIATTADGRILLVTADGRKPGVSVGLTLAELTDILLSFGAVDAANLDGGGSTTMVVQGKIVNSPSDRTGERAVGDVILVTPQVREPKP